MKRYFFAVILVIGFSFNSCNDDDDLGGDPSIKFTDKFEMTEWQRKGNMDQYIYIRFESDYQVFIKQWNVNDLGLDCYYCSSDQTLLYFPDQKITILVNTENYLKYDYKFEEERVIEYNLTYKNGIMEMKKYDGGLKLQTYWEKSETDLNTLELCD